MGFKEFPLQAFPTPERKQHSESYSHAAALTGSMAVEAGQGHDPLKMPKRVLAKALTDLNLRGMNPTMWADDIVGKSAMSIKAQETDAIARNSFNPGSEHAVTAELPPVQPFNPDK